MRITELYLAKRIFDGRKRNGKLSRPVSAIATFTVALSIAAMIIAIVVVGGFKQQITDKLTGFGAHFTISNFDSNNSYESAPVEKTAEVFGKLAANSGIRNIQFYATKPGLIKTKDNIQGVVIKGVDSRYDWTFVRSSLIEGNIPNYSDSISSNEVIISSTIAHLLHLKIGDKVKTFFIQENARMRQFEICGIYNTGIREIDETFMLADLRHIQKLNGWTSDQISGAEVLLNTFTDYPVYYSQLNLLFANLFNADGSKMQVTGIQDTYPQIFDWLSLINTNTLIIIILMLVVSMVNLVSALLIMVLEQASFVGTIRAFGYPVYRVRRVYLLQALFLVFRGLSWGNIIAIGFALIQKYTRFISLDETSYYLSSVPITINLWHLIALNALTIGVITLAMVMPTMFISKISPSRVLRIN